MKLNQEGNWISLCRGFIEIFKNSMRLDRVAFGSISIGSFTAVVNEAMKHSVLYAS